MRIHAVSIRLSFVALFLVYGVPGCGSNATPAGGTGGTTATGGATGSGGISGTGGALDPTAFGNLYKISGTTQMPGWTQDTNPATAATALLTGSATTLVNVIDGGNKPYLDNGCLLYMYQNLVGPDPQLCRLVAMDFGTAANATSMFTYEQQLRNATTPIPGFDASTAIGYSVLSGITAYAHFKASYFEVQLTGYADDTSAAQVAAQFLTVMQTKTN